VEALINIYLILIIKILIINKWLKKGFAKRRHFFVTGGNSYDINACQIRSELIGAIGNEIWQFKFCEIWLSGVLTLWYLVILSF